MEDNQSNSASRNVRKIPTYTLESWSIEFQNAGIYLYARFHIQWLESHLIIWHSNDERFDEDFMNYAKRGPPEK